MFKFDSAIQALQILLHAQIILLMVLPLGLTFILFHRSLCCSLLSLWMSLPHTPFQFVDSHFPALLDSLLALGSFHDICVTPFYTLSPFFHGPLPSPPHPYICASSDFSAVVQLYARSAQLPTNIPLASRFGDLSAFCCFGCPVLEDPHHIFVCCPTFQDFRDESSITHLGHIPFSLWGRFACFSPLPH